MNLSVWASILIILRRPRVPFSRPLEGLRTFLVRVPFLSFSDGAGFSSVDFVGICEPFWLVHRYYYSRTAQGFLFLTSWGSANLSGYFPITINLGRLRTSFPDLSSWAYPLATTTHLIPCTLSPVQLLYRYGTPSTPRRTSSGPLSLLLSNPSIYHIN